MTAISRPPQQLALNVSLRDDATFENFFTLAAVEPLLEKLRQQSSLDGEPIIYLYGATASGKSHLLQAACHYTEESALYLPLRDLREYPPQDVLQGVEEMNLICLDDLETVFGHERWELELFHLLNRARDRGCRLLISATTAPRASQVALADLKSRLSWGIVYQIPLPDDRELEAILQFRARRRGLQLAPEVARFIVQRAPRALTSLLDVLEDIDRASLARQRALSIPFVKEVLGW